jgi:hypothetical protein
VLALIVLDLEMPSFSRDSLGKNGGIVLLGKLRKRKSPQEKMDVMCKCN